MRGPTLLEQSLRCLPESSKAALRPPGRSLRPSSSVASSSRSFATSSARPLHQVSTTTLSPPLLRTPRLAPATSFTAPRLQYRSLSTHPVPLHSHPSQPEEPNVFAKGGEPTIFLTDRAINQLHKIALKNPEKAELMALRIAVEPGGCHGYQYKMELEEETEWWQVGEPDDFRYQPEALDGTATGILSKKDIMRKYEPEAIDATTTAIPKDEIKPLPILIDSVSLTLLQGSTIDYVTELIGSQFAIKDNPQAKGAGCGCGVSWEPIL